MEVDHLHQRVSLVSRPKWRIIGSGTALLRGIARLRRRDGTVIHNQLSEGYQKVHFDEWMLSV